MKEKKKRVNDKRKRKMKIDLRRRSIDTYIIFI